MIIIIDRIFAFPTPAGEREITPRGAPIGSRRIDVASRGAASHRR